MNKSDRPHMQIAKRLRAFRNLIGLNQKEFALKHNFSQTQYTNWETGERRIPIEKAALLEDHYGLTLDFIYLGRLRTLPHSLADALSDNPSVSRYKIDKDTPVS